MSEESAFNAVTEAVMTAHRKQIRELEDALRPFALMYRAGDEDNKELACQRGVASDMTVITNEDWAKAYQVFNSSCKRG